MLEIRITCENCKGELPNDSSQAMICTYECTFCKDCVDDILFNVCPNCGGGFEKRPIRPKDELIQNPERKDIIYKPVVKNKFLEKYVNLEPNERWFNSFYLTIFGIWFLRGFRRIDLSICMSSAMDCNRSVYLGTGFN